MKHLFKVAMTAFNDDETYREVEVPDGELEEAGGHWMATAAEVLHMVFKWGQNDFQPKECCSVSVGDVIEIEVVPGDVRHYSVEYNGFLQVTANDVEALWKLDRREGRFVYTEGMRAVYGKQAKRVVR